MPINYDHIWSVIEEHFALDAWSLHGPELEAHQLDFLVEACRGHHHGTTSESITIGTCWDADRLDLPRVGMSPEEAYMSTPEGKRLARAFWEGPAR